MNNKKNASGSGFLKTACEREFVGEREAIDKNFDQGDENLAAKRHLAYVRALPLRFQGLFRKVFLSSVAPRQAIKAKCIDCVGFETVSMRIQNCPTWKCPLWQYRPYRSE